MTKDIYNSAFLAGYEARARKIASMSGRASEIARSIMGHAKDNPGAYIGGAAGAVGGAAIGAASGSRGKRLGRAILGSILGGGAGAGAGALVDHGRRPFEERVDPAAQASLASYDDDQARLLAGERDFDNESIRQGGTGYTNLPYDPFPEIEMAEAARSGTIVPPRPSMPSSGPTMALPSPQFDRSGSGARISAAQALRANMESAARSGTIVAGPSSRPSILGQR